MGGGFQCSSSSASNDAYDDETLLKKLCVLPCMPQNAPECASEHLNFLGEHAPRPPKVNDCRVAMFSTSANDIAPPQIEKVMYGPECPLIDFFFFVFILTFAL